MLNDSHSNEQLTSYMPFVSSCRNSLQKTSQWWQKVSLVRKVNSLGMASTLLEELEHTRKQFEHLQSQLVENLATESVQGLGGELSFRAQLMIDVLIRNLFERTADVGFLAADDDVRRFLGLPDPEPNQQERIKERLKEYRSKYTVYDDIFILDPHGKVLASMNESSSMGQLADSSLVAETLQANGSYLERLEPSDLQPQHKQSHQFSMVVTETENSGSPVIGIICLCFNLQEEMQNLFANLSRADEILALVDHQQTVLMSSNDAFLPTGQKIPAETAGDEPVLISVQDKPYLAHSLEGIDYEGYRGLGWRGCYLQPLKTAFQEMDPQSSELSPGYEESPLSGHEHLEKIQNDAHRVTGDLSLAVLNGQIIAARQHKHEFDPILDEIRGIGNQTREIFKQSIGKLRSTVVEAKLADIRLRAFLAVDIMDRNLYERANDVRWWALNSRVREIMAQTRIDGASQSELTQILVTINELYTVYTSLLVFDRDGQCVAVSNETESALLGTSLAGQLPLTDVWKVKDAMHYTVSDFQPTPLYADRSTYIYSAPIRAPEGGKVVAGIGIVFDSQPQFQAMLDSALLGDAGILIDSNAFALFLDNQCNVIASTRDDIQIGEMFELDPYFHGISAGERRATRAENEGIAGFVSAAMSQGYREYKTWDGYSNDVMAYVFIPA